MVVVVVGGMELERLVVVEKGGCHRRGWWLRGGDDGWWWQMMAKGGRGSMPRSDAVEGRARWRVEPGQGGPRAPDVTAGALVGRGNSFLSTRACEDRR